MTYTAHITVKGQITIPSLFREKMNIKQTTKLSISLDESSGEIRVKPLPDFFELSKTIKIKNKKNIMKARDVMESHYERI